MIPFNGGNIPAAGTYIYPLEGVPLHAKTARFQGTFTFNTAGGTSLKNYLQTTFDGGVTWQDVICIAFLAASLRVLGLANKAIVAPIQNPATDGTLADNTLVNGTFGSHWRIKQVIVGAYNADNILRLDVNFEEDANA